MNPFHVEDLVTSQFLLKLMVRSSGVTRLDVLSLQPQRRGEHLVEPPFRFKDSLTVPVTVLSSGTLPTVAP